MAGSSNSLHEAEERLRPQTLDRHRAIVSLMEELEAIDWYDQRIDATGDAELAAILTHNRDEETEHASMTLEWLRRQLPALDNELRRYLFNPGAIAAEAAGEQGGQTGAAPAAAAAGDGSLGVGSLSGKEQL